MMRVSDMTQNATERATKGMSIALDAAIALLVLEESATSWRTARMTAAATKTTATGDSAIVSTRLTLPGTLSWFHPSVEQAEAYPGVVAGHVESVIRNEERITTQAPTDT